MTELDKIIKARSKLMKGHVGMASMLLHLKLVEVSEARCSTMATDGRRIFYSSKFVSEIPENELQGVLVHESLHVVYEHPLRRGKRHFKVWNFSCDYAINGFLIYDLGMELPKGGLWDRKYHQKSAEEIYRILINDEAALQDAIDQIGEGQGEQSEEEGDSNSGEQSEEAEEISNTGKCFSPTGEKCGQIDLDSLPQAVGEVWDAQDEEGNPLSDSEITELKGEIQRAVSLADKLEKAMGTDGTSSVSQRVEQLKEVHVDWKDQLNDFLQSTLADDNTWSRPNRRHSWRGIHLPSKTKAPHGGELAIAIDTSGSVSQFELNMFATEIQAMAEDCGLEKIRVCYCDTTVIKNEQGEWWDIYELDQGEELNLKVRGGGGTWFDPPFNLFNDYSEDVEEVQAFVYFTDGWGTVDAEVEPCVPVVWCVTEESSYAEELPFGEVVYVDTAGLY